MQLLTTIEGKLYKCQETSEAIFSYWIAPLNSDEYHLENCLINIATGKILHFSRLIIHSFDDYEKFFD